VFLLAPLAPLALKNHVTTVQRRSALSAALGLVGLLRGSSLNSLQAILTGGGPPDPQNIAFLPSRHRNKAGRFVNRRGIAELAGFAEQRLPIRAPLDRFRVGLVT
jgi:hypothetical protein